MENKELDDIFRIHVPKLHSFVRGRVNNQADAEDIVQDTIYQFLRTIRVLDNPISHVSAWLYTVAHNLIINHGKKHREASMPATSDNGESFMRDISDILMTADSESPDIRMLRAMMWQELDKALSELPPEQREAILMTEFHGMPVKEAARRMGVPQNTFLSRKHYAVLHIRKRLHALYNELINN